MVKYHTIMLENLDAVELYTLQERVNTEIAKRKNAELKIAWDDVVTAVRKYLELDNAIRICTPEYEEFCIDDTNIRCFAQTPGMINIY